MINKKSVLFAFIIFSFLSIFSCTVEKENVSPLLPYKSEAETIKVAILPFENQTAYPDAADIMRETFYGVFSSESFQDMELSKIDDLLDENGIFTGEDVAKAGYDKLSKMTGAKLLISGKVLRHDVLYLVLYSVVTVELEITITDADKGKVIYTSSKRLRNIGGTFPTPPFGFLSFIPSPIASLMNLSTRSFLLADWELCRLIIDDISLKIK